MCTAIALVGHARGMSQEADGSYVLSAYRVVASWIVCKL